MGESCNGQCGSCAQSCSSRSEQSSFRCDTNEGSNVKKVIGIVSGKGGVGKSLVTSLLAGGMQKRGFQTAILDADITGPSIPKAFGIHGKAQGTETEIFPMKSKNGTKIISLNFLVQNETDPVIWRGPIIAGVVKQFWEEVTWGDVDCMFVDMPPGTGDVPLTVFQSMPLSGIIVVTSPQELVSMIVAKAVSMARQMNIPIIGLVENMSYLVCPDCEKKIDVFGKSRIKEVAEQFGIETYAQMPIIPEIAQACDKGEIEEISANDLEPLLDKIIKLPEERA